jgi:L-threonylcarbamoyladenylate synthase
MQAMTKTNLNTFMFEKDKIEDIIPVLSKGGLILYPTDTIWGIGCNACDEQAIKRIYKLKQRATSKNFVILVDSIDMLKKYVREVPPRIQTLLSYHTRPLTMVFDDPRNLPQNLIASDNTIAVRIAQDEFCQDLIGTFGFPLVATSANISSQPFPANFGEINSDIIKGVDYIVKIRRHEKAIGQPSVIAKIMEDGELEFLRE